MIRCTSIKINYIAIAIPIVHTYTLTTSVDNEISFQLSGLFDNSGP